MRPRVKPRIAATGSPRTMATDSLRTIATDSPRTTATGSLRMMATDSPRTMATNSPRMMAMVRFRRGAKVVEAKLILVVHVARPADMALVSKPAAKQEVMASLALPAHNNLVDNKHRAATMMIANRDLDNLVNNKHHAAAMTMKKTKKNLIEKRFRGSQKLSLPW